MTPEQLEKRRKASRERNRRLRASGDMYSTRWARENREQSRAIGRAYAKNNREKVNAYRRHKMASDPSFKAACVLRGRLSEIFREGYRSIRGKMLIYIGCTVPELRRWFEQQFDEAMTWENRGVYWEIDHKIPCASFDLTDEDQRKLCFHFTNLQPLRKPLNQSKGARLTV